MGGTAQKHGKSFFFPIQVIIRINGAFLQRYFLVMLLLLAYYIVPNTKARNYQTEHPSFEKTLEIIVNMVDCPIVSLLVVYISKLLCEINIGFHHQVTSSDIYMVCLTN